MKRVVLFMILGASCASPKPAQPEPVSFDEAPVMEPEAGPVEPIGFNLMRLWMRAWLLFRMLRSMLAWCFLTPVLSMLVD